MLQELSQNIKCETAMMQFDLNITNIARGCGAFRILCFNILSISNVYMVSDIDKYITKCYHE